MVVEQFLWSEVQEKRLQYKQRREIILSSYKRAKNQGDENVYFIDGETLLAGSDYMSCTVDGIHPNDLGFHHMSQIICKTLAEILKI